MFEAELVLAIFRNLACGSFSLADAFFLQMCEQQPLCNAFGAVFIIAYAAAATAAILAIMAYVRRKRSDRALR